MPRRSGERKLSEQELQLQRERRAAHELKLEGEQRQLKIERAHVLLSFLHKHGSGGLLVVEDVSEEAAGKFREGFEMELGKRLLLLPAEGNVQGEERDEVFAEQTLLAISQHRREHREKGVFGFDGVDFSGKSGRGTPLVANWVSELLTATRVKPRNSPAVVAFGTGLESDMPTSGQYIHDRYRGFVDQLEIVLGLDEHGEAKTVLDPSVQTVFSPRVSSLFTQTDARPLPSPEQS
jgi:hypothetical protein